MTKPEWNDTLFKKVSMPDSIREFADYLYTPFDLNILAETDEQGFVVKKYRRSWLEHLWRRGILDKVEENGEARYRAADVCTRLESFIVLEKAYWLSLPQEVRDAINGRYIMNPDIWLPRHIARGRAYTETILPLEDCIHIIEESYCGYGYLAECNCNNYIGGCDRDKYQICVHFPEKEASPNCPDGRGLSKRVGKEELIEAMRHADRQGLVHKLGGTGRNFCNCCSCCCIHHHNAEKYEAALRETLLQTPYVIAVDKEKCIGCGACMRQCQFDVLSLKDKKIHVDSEKCWGCGVCRAKCPTGALQIQRRG